MIAIETVTAPGRITCALPESITVTIKGEPITLTGQDAADVYRQIGAVLYPLPTFEGGL